MMSYMKLMESVSISEPNMRQNSQLKEEQYQAVVSALDALLTDSTDWVAAMSTVICELHNTFDHYHWTGFYRVTSPGHLQVGPYQGGHGCLDIPFTRGVCGAAARLQKTQLVEDVNAIEDHIACSSSTQSELVVPVLSEKMDVIAVLDVDSDYPNAFDQIDQHYLEVICQKLGHQFGAS